MKLFEYGHSRSGDKGNIFNLSFILYNINDYDYIKEKVTSKRVKEYFKDICLGEVIRYELPQIGGFNFVLKDSLDGGCTNSTRLDKHGKTLSGAFLEMEI